MLGIDSEPPQTEIHRALNHQHSSKSTAFSLKDSYPSTQLIKAFQPVKPGEVTVQGRKLHNDLKFP